MDINCITSYWLRTSSIDEMWCGSGLEGQCLRATCISQLRVKGCTCCSCFVDSGLQIVIVKVVVVILKKAIIPTNCHFEHQTKKEFTHHISLKIYVLYFYTSDS